MKKLEFEANIQDIGKYGEITTPFKVSDFNDIGIEFVDTVKVSFLDNELIIPFVPNYRCVKAGGDVMMAYKEGAYVDIISFHSNFVKKYKIAMFIENENKEVEIIKCKNITFPIKFTLELDKKNGYKEEFKIYDLIRTNNRDDYKELSDEEFCNFRNIKVGKIKEGLLYRSSSPIDPILGRNSLTDDLLKKYGIKTIINLSDTKEKAINFPNFNNTYYSKQNIIYLNINADIFSYNFGKNVIKAFKFMINNDPPYLIHCIEGQDRTGAVCALIEALYYGNKEQIKIDYMKTYENFYKIKRYSDRYNKIVNGALQDDIITVRGFGYGIVDILKYPEFYLIYFDLLNEDLEKFKKILL